MRRGEIGHHHQITGKYLIQYAQESAWREDHRKAVHKTQVRAAAMLAMAAPVSVHWCCTGSGREQSSMRRPREGER